MRAEPGTQAELEAQLIEGGFEPWVATLAVSLAIEHGYVHVWGMSEEGEVVYVMPHVVVFAP